MQTMLLLCVVFIASVARGYTGFGLSAIVLTIVSYWIPAKELVPLLILLEITASLFFIRSVSTEINWRIIGIIFTGAAITTPLALYSLSVMPSDITHSVIAGMVLLATAILLSGNAPHYKTNDKTWFATGIVMGIFGGLGSIGGLAGMVMLMSVSTEAAKARATMIILLLITSVYAALFSVFNGLLTTENIRELFILLPSLMAGLYVGHYLFKRYTKSFRTASLILLSVLSGIMFVQSIRQTFA